MEWTKSIWTMNAESAKRIGHPAPFPVELPYRLIQLYSFKNDIVLDPFVDTYTITASDGSSAQINCTGLLHQTTSDGATVINVHERTRFF